MSQVRRTNLLEMRRIWRLQDTEKLCFEVDGSIAMDQIPRPSGAEQTYEQAVIPRRLCRGVFDLRFSIIYQLSKKIE